MSFSRSLHAMLVLGCWSLPWCLASFSQFLLVVNCGYVSPSTMLVQLGNHSPQVILGEDRCLLSSLVMEGSSASIGLECMNSIQTISSML